MLKRWQFLLVPLLILLHLTTAAGVVHADASSAPVVIAERPTGSELTYTVRVNDTLWDIATRYNISLEALVAANRRVNPKRLIAGQILTIPGARQRVAARPFGATYTVRADDTLWDIATNYGLYVADLLAANPGVDPRRMMVGQQLVIPGLTAEALAATRAPTSVPAAAQTPTLAVAPMTAQGLAPELETWVQELLSRINEKRAAGGRAMLVWNDALALAAQLHAEDCAQRNRGSHIGSDGAKLRTRLDRAGYAYQWAGENWANARSAAHAFEMWWNEPPGADPHVQNIMANRATEIGIGIARGAWGYYIIADFGSQ